jgi:hypothetical protein
MQDFVNQFRHVGRSLRRSPMFTCVTLLTLAIGIGANTAIFSVINGILLKPLSYPEPDKLVAIWQKAPGLGMDKRLETSPAEYFVFREENRTLQSFGVWEVGSTTVTGIADPERVESLNATHEVLEALGVRPALGRAFTAQDDQPGRPDVIILTHAYWQRRLGANPAAVGRRMVVNGRAKEIVGVMPAAFRFLDRKLDLIQPLRFDRGRVFVGNFSYHGIARLKPSATIAQATADIARMIPMLFTRFPAPPALA